MPQPQDPPADAIGLPPRPTAPGSMSGRAGGAAAGIQPWLLRYGLALVVAAGSLAIRLVVWPFLGTSAPFLHSFPAVIFVAWVAGFGPSVLVTVFTMVTSAVLFVAPRWSVDVAASSDLAALLIYPVVGLLIGWMTSRFRAARRAAEEARLAAEEATAVARAQAAHNERLVRVRDGFASMLAHELRTPLTVIIGDLALLRRMEATLPDPAPELIADMQAESGRLQVLVEDLLVLNRDDGQLDLSIEPTSVRHAVDELLRVRAREDVPAGLAVTIPTDLPLVQADAVCLGQVLRNLLSNARKYGAPPVRLVAEPRGRSVRISVIDSGPGLAAGDEERIFELFVRGAERPPGSPGAGVGLYVCRRLTTAMGGRIWAERLPEGGTAFRVELPAAGEDAEWCEDWTNGRQVG